MSQTNQSPLDSQRDQIEVWLSKGLSYNQIVLKLENKGIPTSKRSLGRAIKRWGLQVQKPEGAKVEIDGDKASVTSEAALNLNDPESLIKERGLDPEEWDLDRIKVNEWDSPTGETLKQLTVNLVRKAPLDLPVPSRVDLNLAPKTQAPKTDGPKLIVFAGDQQAPFHDQRLHMLFCDWLAQNKPDEGILIGDTVDLPDISKHPFEPEWKASVQECIDGAGQLLYDVVSSSFQTKWKKLSGNHDERLRRVIIDKIPDLYKLRRARIKGDFDSPVVSIEYLLRLDELGIEYVDCRGAYDQGQVKLSPYLAARHGWIAKKGSGASALATLEHLGHSIVVGHTHRQSQVHKTRHDLDGSVATLTAVETGCMCQIKDGLGYAISPDWQNGFATAQVWPDGRFKLELATYVNNALYWRGERYE